MARALAVFAARPSSSDNRQRLTFLHQGTGSAATARPRSSFRRCARALLALPLAAIAAGCWAAPPAPLADADPSNPSARTRPVEYRSTVEPYKTQRPVEP